MVCRTRLQFVVHLMYVALLSGLAFLWFAEPACMAQQTDIQLPGGEDFKEMHITDGERMVFLQGKLESLEEHVELRLTAASEDGENVKLRADRISFSYAEDTQELDKVVASGNVSFTMETSERQLQADEVTWFTVDNRAEFRGDPKVISERGTLTGDSIVHYLSDDRTVVTKPRAVFVIPDAEETEKETGGENEAGQ